MGIETIIIEQALKESGLAYKKEFLFVPNRKFRADFAIPSLKILIEYEGVFSRKSRHTTVSGYSKDCQKYNFAAKLGYRVLRYTAKNYTEFLDDLKIITDES